MTTRYVQDALKSLLKDGDVATFDERSILTRNDGLVLKLADGSEYQLTIVQSKRGEYDDEEN